MISWLWLVPVTCVAFIFGMLVMGWSELFGGGAGIPTAGRLACGLAGVTIALCVSALWLRPIVLDAYRHGVEDGVAQERQANRYVPTSAACPGGRVSVLTTLPEVKRCVLPEEYRVLTQGADR